ncbi:hypothetical protein CKW39_05125 [Kocuria sp. WRN011]|uniref:Uncharacterized protein n=1 Tax=Kocuria atrinae TaxID=592377 RepID=A0ABN2Y9A7_9MICC|nr:hypothetical protein CKW39_05125 [Kocuria sp. WRN011]PZP26924.1 MAG: hypothetical protein DI613_14950 [Kocuria rhizophila]
MFTQFDSVGALASAETVVPSGIVTISVTMLATVTSEQATNNARPNHFGAHAAVVAGAPVTRFGC